MPEKKRRDEDVGEGHHEARALSRQELGPRRAHQASLHLARVRGRSRMRSGHAEGGQRDRDLDSARAAAARGAGSVLRRCTSPSAALPDAIPARKATRMMVKL